MALNPPIIAGAPVTTRADTATVVVRVTSSSVFEPAYLPVDGVLVPVNQYPEKEGQIIVYRNGSDLFATMYVAVNDEYVGEGRYLLAWKKVQNWGLVIDPRTGLEKDPNLEFYSTLAS